MLFLASCSYPVLGNARTGKLQTQLLMFRDKIVSVARLFSEKTVNIFLVGVYSICAVCQFCQPQAMWWPLVSNGPAMGWALTVFAARA